MDKNKIKKLLEEVEKGNKSVEEALKTLQNLPFIDLGFAKIDTHRELRMNAPEAIYCMNKTPTQIIKIMEKMKPDSNIIATRVSKESLQKIKKKFPEAEIYPDANLVFIGTFPKKTIGKIIIITAGTSDIPVARESEITAKSMGVEVQTFFDVGIAGIHRVFSIKKELKEADIAIVIAGMEGALPSVVAGLVDTPIIAVPTSVGYGANLQGIA
ncbi:MAG: nickel pincer cofactor biosynthesis protein LarB, partial [candidate division WOR-3 bacterium]